MANNECTLTDEQLAELGHKLLTELCASNGLAWRLKQPVDFNSDPDMVFCEIIKRMLRGKRLDFSFDKDGIIKFNEPK